MAATRPSRGPGASCMRAFGGRLPLALAAALVVCLCLCITGSAGAARDLKSAGVNRHLLDDSYPITSVQVPTTTVLDTRAQTLVDTRYADVNVNKRDGSGCVSNIPGAGRVCWGRRRSLQSTYGSKTAVDLKAAQARLESDDVKPMADDPLAIMNVVKPSAVRTDVNMEAPLTKVKSSDGEGSVLGADASADADMEVAGFDGYL
ncbi:hypothetical protein GPECTOR_29g123 [Gonium pectorale]|uniref:Uncharacterized protein n=1 Tax=Gonium pectorale TaxID=33097 RepID=A0A150GEH9_GONPE|nr:hypothetical protein GPECTOR_29g123 [Gonium pectorale]|eukprot:KXZ48218.1 hypothetical protein GPECTOR_29g123 [Gonium pectorale]